jgi:hypothetical protein
MKQATKMMLPVMVKGRGKAEAVVREDVSMLLVLLLYVGVQVALGVA